MSWALAKCPEFLKAIVATVVPVTADPKETVVLNQQYTADTGITDIEVTDYRTFHVIFEAKRGWVLPGADQLTKYSVRKDFVSSKAAHKAIVTLSECTETYAGLYLPFHSVNGVPVNHLPWSKVYELAEQSKAASNHEQKHLLAEK